MKREKLRWDKDERDRDETNTVKKRRREADTSKDEQRSVKKSWNLKTRVKMRWEEKRRVEMRQKRKAEMRQKWEGSRWDKYRQEEEKRGGEQKSVEKKWKLKTNEDEMKREGSRWDETKREVKQTEKFRWDENTIVFVKTNWVQMRRWEMKRNERRADGTRRGGEARQLERRDESYERIQFSYERVMREYNKSSKPSTSVNRSLISILPQYLSNRWNNSLINSLWGWICFHSSRSICN